MAVFSLSIHADYRCRRSGACCSTDWDVPVELPVYTRLNAEMASGRLRTSSPFILEPRPPESAAAVLRRERGTCVLFDGGTHLCRVHRDVGEEALPSTCRLFPRIALNDDRGTFITLSHYCPTAASMLFRADVPLAIVEGPEAFPPGDYGGLTAQGAWPPLLHSWMLADLDAYTAWEHHAVGVFASPSVTPESALATLERDVELLRAWRPGGESLVDAITALPSEVVDRDAAVDAHAASGLYRVVAACAPEELQPAEVPRDLDMAYREQVRDAWSTFSTPLTRFLAAHAFANWCAYQGRGLRSHVRSLEMALSVVIIESVRACVVAGRGLDRDLLLQGVRQSDFLLRHQASQHALARAWSRADDAATAS